MGNDKPLPPPVRDWRDEATYEDLKRLDRRGFAWEYLRRNETFRETLHETPASEMRVVRGALVIYAAPNATLEQWGLRFRRTPKSPGSTRPALLASGLRPFGLDCRHPACPTW